MGRGIPEEQLTTDQELIIGTHPRLHRLAATLDVLPEAWVVSNRGSRLSIRVVSHEGQAIADISPGRVYRCHEQNANIEVLIDGSVKLSVTVESSLPYSEILPTLRTDTELDSLNRDLRYFRTLLLLCERRLNDPLDLILPSDREISVQIKLLEIDSSMNARKVAKDLLRTRRHLSLAGSPDQSMAGLEQPDARSRLADLAIRSGVVRFSDLRLLRRPLDSPQT